LDKHISKITTKIQGILFPQHLDKDKSNQNIITNGKNFFIIPNKRLVFKKCIIYYYIIIINGFLTKIIQFKYFSYNKLLLIPDHIH